jgi:predicted ATP-binding protein involved in virulence
MRIAAIFIEEHDYLINKPQTINFGGKYSYGFMKELQNVIVTRIPNDTFIIDFFNLTQIESKITNINAIVGQNGAGKSTILDIIRSEFIEHKHALPESNALFLVETDDASGVPLILRNDFRKVILEAENGERFELRDRINNLQTIYYSPHFDYKYNAKFDDIDNHDISFDKMLAKDLIPLVDDYKNEDGWLYSPSQLLLFRNSIRQIEFLSSPLVSQKRIFDGIFPLQEHYDPILYFKSYKKRESNWNTPSQLRIIINLIFSKLDSELNNWRQIKITKDKRVINQVEINQYILKRNVMLSIMDMICSLLERKNSYLEEGYFPYEHYRDELEFYDAYELFFIFINESGLEFDSDEKINIFDSSVVTNLIEKIYQAIEKSQTEETIKNLSIITSKEDAVEILKLQRQFLNQLSTYYNRFPSVTENIPLDDYEKLNDFILYMPFSRRLSSGENALLNLFSRIYNFLESNLKEPKFRKLNDHYILLLDEADLTFHPTWKKKYVKALIKTLPHIFNELENKPSLQIIFTTHDPLTLSDLPNSNVIYLERRTYEDKAKILNVNDPNRPSKTFGANISDLLADSFFIEESLIGNFAFDKIQETIVWLSNKEDVTGAEYYKKLIQIIDEPIVQRKLAEMYDNKMEANFQLTIVNDQLKKLEDLKKKLEK